MRPRCLLLVLVPLVAPACQSYDEARLPTFDAAMALATTQQAPALYRPGELPRDLPLAAPYLQLVRDFPRYIKEAEQSRQLLAECAERDLHPDFVVFQDRSLSAPGSALQASPTVSNGGIYGFTFTAAPVLRGQAAVTCFRLAPVSLGFVADANWMVTLVEEPARSIGLLEGDSVQLIDGADVKPRTPQEVPPWLAAALSKKPGDIVEVVWIRPGTGRMRGKLTLQEPEQMRSTRSR